MIYLIDTHALIWFLSNSKQLSKKALEAIENENVVVSIASLWEISLKISLGKLKLAQPFAEVFPKQLEINSIEILPIAIEHLKLVSELEYFHRDPFDRLIIVQAISEGMTLISKDSVFQKYDVDLLW